jgi:hypothetical protein
VWMSNDGGITFTPIADALATQAVGGIALDREHHAADALRRHRRR